MMDEELVNSYVRMLLSALCREWESYAPASRDWDDAIRRVENDIAKLREAAQRLRARK